MQHDIFSKYSFANMSFYWSFVIKKLSEFDFLDVGFYFWLAPSLKILPMYILITDALHKDNKFRLTSLIALWLKFVVVPLFAELRTKLQFVP